MRDIIIRSGRRRRSRRSLAGAISCALLLTYLAACGSDSTSEDSAASGSGGSGDSGYVAASRKLLAEASAGAVTGPSMGAAPIDKLVPWKAADMPAPSTLPGKPVKVDVVYAFPVGSPPYSTHLLQAVGERLGWKIKVFQAASGTPQGALAAMRQAILDKPDAIITPVVSPLWIRPALDEARKQGIRTVSIHGNGTAAPGLDAYVTAAEGLQKEVLGAWVVAESAGKASTVLFSSPGFEEAEVAAAAQFLKDCSGCKTESLQLNPDVMLDPTKLQSGVSAALATRPDTDFVLWPQGTIPLQGAVNGIKTSRAKDARLVVNAAGPQDVQLLKAGQLPVVVHVPEAMLAIVALDQVSRLVQKQPPLADDALRLPVTYWSKDTAPNPDYGSITAAQLRTTDWLAPYEKAWDVQLKDTVVAVKG